MIASHNKVPDEVDNTNDHKDGEDSLKNAVGKGLGISVDLLVEARIHNRIFDDSENGFYEFHWI